MRSIPYRDRRLRDAVAGHHGSIRPGLYFASRFERRNLIMAHLVRMREIGRTETARMAAEAEDTHGGMRLRPALKLAERLGFEAVTAFPTPGGRIDFLGNRANGCLLTLYSKGMTLAEANLDAFVLAPDFGEAADGPLSIRATESLSCIIQLLAATGYRFVPVWGTAGGDAYHPLAEFLSTGEEHRTLIQTAEDAGKDPDDRVKAILDARAAAFPPFWRDVFDFERRRTKADATALAGYGNPRETRP